MSKCTDPEKSDPYTITWCSAVLDAGKESEKNIALAYRWRGLARAGVGQLELGLKDLDQAIRLDSRDSEHFQARCALRKSMGDKTKNTVEYNGAVSDCSRAIELNPKDHFAFNNRGNAYSALKQYDNAISDYTKALEFVRFPAAYYNRALDYDALGKYDLALQDLKLAIEANPRYSEAIELRRRVQAKTKSR